MIKKLALGCLVAAALAGIALVIAWRQATRLPDWYGASQASSTGPPAAAAEAAAPSTDGSLPVAPAPAPAPSRGEAAAGVAESRAHRGSDTVTPPTPDLEAQPPPGGDRPAPPLAPAPPPRATRPAPAAGALGPGRVELDEAELNALLARSLDEHPRGQRLKRALKGMHASIDGDRLEVGVVTNLTALGAAAETEREARAVRRLAQLAPWLGDRDVYLAVRGRPRVRDGHLVLDRDGELKVGGFTFDIADFASRLGVPEEKLDRGVELPLAGHDGGGRRDHRLVMRSAETEREVADGTEIREAGRLQLEDVNHPEIVADLL